MKQLPRRDAPPSMLASFLRRLREITWLGESENGGLRETLDTLITEAEQEAGAPLGEEERTLLKNALGFGELRVDDVMVPRADLKGIELKAPLLEVVRAMREAGHSRLLVYRDTLDDVQGLVHVKDLLPFWGDGESFALAEVLRPVLVVPPSMRVGALLLHMRSERNHTAVVVDEFGGTDGLVTIEDLAEEIVGELQDEGKPAGEPGLVANPDGTIDADGRTYLEDLEERLGIPLLEADERDEVDTLAGLLFTLLDRVPARGEVVTHPSGLRFEVLDADPRRIKRVRVHLPGAGEAPATPNAA